MDETSVYLQLKYPNCGLGTFGTWKWLVGLKSTVLESREGRSGLPSSAPSPTRQRPFDMVVHNRRANQTVQDVFSIIKAEHQSNLDGSENKCYFTSETQMKIYSLLLISFAFLYLLLWHNHPLHLFTLTWGLRLTYFICPDGLHRSVKDDLSVPKRYVCQVPCMLSLIYCLPGGMLSQTGI